MSMYMFATAFTVKELLNDSYFLHRNKFFSVIIIVHKEDIIIIHESS